MWKFYFQVIPVLAWGVALLAGVLPLKLRTRTFLLVAVVLAACFGKFAFFALVGGDAFVPNLPPGVIWTYGGVYGAAMFFAAFACAARLIDVPFALCHRPVALRTKRVRSVVLALLAAATAGWGMYEGVSMPAVKRVEVAWDELPAAFDGYRIVQLSDIHCSTAARRGRIEGIVARVNALGADLVAITGDFVDGTVADRGHDLEPLADLKTKDGVVGCTGNHEAYWEWGAWHAKFREWKVEMLAEGHPRVIRRGGYALALGGITDPAFWGRRMPPSPAREAFVGTPDAAFRVLLFHRPFTSEIGSEEAGVRLQLSGHTHGGAFPLIHWLVARANEGHTRGLYEFAPGRYLYNSPGTGQWAGFPIRLFNPTEITEIVLRRRETSDATNKKEGEHESK